VNTKILSSKAKRQLTVYCSPEESVLNSLDAGSRPEDWVQSRLGVGSEHTMYLVCMYDSMEAVT
jgi:hypothetical protein